MTNKLLILSTIFFIACSSNDINGYTDSIIKGLNETSDSPKKSYSLHKEGDPTSQSTSDNISSSSSETLYSITHDSYSGKIELFEWRNEVPDFREPENYPYGFDKDPNPNQYGRSYDPLIYVSLEIQENRTEYDPSAKDIPIIELYNPSSNTKYIEFYLLHEKHTKGILDEKGRLVEGNVEKLMEEVIKHGIKFTEKTEKEIITDITRNEKIKYSIYSKLEDANNNTYALGYSKENNGKKEYIIYPPLSQNNQQLKKYILEEGIYNLIGKRKLENSKKNSEFNSLERRVKILHYTRKELNFVYVQIDGKKGDGWSPQSDKNSFITKEIVENVFNKIYRQAVVYPIIKVHSTKDYDIEGVNDDVIDYELTNPNDDIYSEFVTKAVKKAKEMGVHKSSPYLHIIFAINKMRKKWRLERCLNDLSKCAGFNPENEPDYVKYKIYGCDNIVEDKAQDVEIKVSKKTVKENDKTIEKKFFHILRKGANGEEIDGYRKCDILFTDNGYPIVPSKTSSQLKAAAISSKIPRQKPNCDPDPSDSEKCIDKEKMPLGSVIFIPRYIGEEAQNVIMHELGHSFGLTDVVQSKDLISYRNKAYDYATTETNVMTWKKPAGNKIRFRATPIACTAGTQYYKIVYDTNNEPQLVLIDALERELRTDKIQNANENQWECIRGQCYEEDYLEKNLGSKEYWWPSNLDGCLDTKPENLNELLLGKNYPNKSEYQKYKQRRISKEDGSEDGTKLLTEEELKSKKFLIRSNKIYSKRY